MKWYNTGTVAPVPAPAAPAAYGGPVAQDVWANQSNLTDPAKFKRYSDSISQQHIEAGWRGDDISGQMTDPNSRVYNQAGVAADLSGDLYVGPDGNLYSTSQGFQGLGDYASQGFGQAATARQGLADQIAGIDTSGIGTNASAIQQLQNAGYLTASDLPAQQDISGIGQNQAAIQQAQGQLAGLQQQLNSLPPGYDDTAIRQQMAQIQSSIPAQQDISGIGQNAAAIQALQNRAPQDISGIGQNAAAIQALQNAPQQDISGISNNAAAIQALQNTPQQDISGIAGNNAMIQALQQQIADLNRGPAVPPPGTPPAPGQPTPVAPGLNTPVTNTGIQGGGAARPYIDDYFAGTSPFGQLDFSGFQGTQGGGGSNYGYAPTQQQAPAPTPVPTPPPASTPTPPPAPPQAPPTDAETYGEYGSGVSDEAQEIREQYVDPELPFDPFDQSDKAAGTSWGGGVDEVIAAREELPPELTPPPAPAPGTSQEEAHQVVEESFENFGDILNDPEVSNVQKAAANPAFNPEIALAAAESPVEIETPAGETYTVPARDLNSVDASAALGSQYSAGVDESGYIDPFGGTAPANGGTNAIAEQAEQKAKAAGASATEAKAAGTEAKKKAERKQSEILGKSVLAAGVSNVGGKFNQSGDNQGLKDDWLVVGDSKGGQEVWAPDGKTYESVDAAKKAGGTKDKKKEPSVRDKALVKAAQIAKEMADRGPSRREQNEINERARAAKAEADRIAAERQAHLDTLSTDQQHDFRANEAIQSRDRGDLKNLMREMGIRYKKDDSSSKLINKLKAGMASRQAPPPPPQPVPTPQAPPPQAPVQASPSPAPPPPPQPQVTPAPAAPPPPPKPVEEVTPQAPSLPPAIANVNLSNSGSMKTAIYAARKAGIPIKAGSLRKKSSSELRRMLQQAGLA